MREEDEEDEEEDDEVKGNEQERPEGRKTRNKRIKRDKKQQKRVEREGRRHLEEEERQRKNRLGIRLVGSHRLPTWQVQINGHPCDVRLDTCAEESIVAGRLAHLGSWVEETSSRWLEGASGGLLRVKGRVRLEWVVQGRCVVVEPLVVDGLLEDMLLGNPFFDHHGCQMAYDTRTLNFPKWELKVPFELHIETAERVRVRRAAVIRTHGIGAMSGSRVHIAIDAPEGMEVQFVPDRTNRRARCLLAATVATVQKGAIMVPAVNGTEQVGYLDAQEEVGSWTPLSDELQVLEQPEQTTTEELVTWLAQIAGEPNAELPGEEQLALDHLSLDHRALLLRVLRSVGEEQELAGDAAGDELWLALRGELNRGQTVPRRVISSKGKKGQVREAEEKREERESTTVTPTSITATWQRMIQQLAAPSRPEGAPGSVTSATPHTATSGVAGTAEIPETAPGGEWRRPPVAEDPPQLTHAKIAVAQAHSDR
ncbi:hypothetical protein DYB28_005723, partial [Aphanomyces astaci]